MRNTEHIRKWTGVLLALVLALSLTACQDRVRTGITEPPPDHAEQTPDSTAVQTPGNGTAEETPAHEMPDSGTAESATHGTDDSTTAQTPDSGAESTSDNPLEPETPLPDAPLPEDGVYTARDDVALYLRQYGHLPGNFITKTEARALGWNGGSLEQYAPGKCIGGDRFGNYEGLLPEQYSYQECDIDTLGTKNRGAKRLVFSGNTVIYYTEDHYNTFTLLYGEEDAG